jgi:Ca2+/Na+ antiporter
LKIKYTVDISDIVAFNQFHLDTSPLVRKQRIKMLIFVAVVYASIAFFMATGKHSIYNMSVFVIVYACFLFWYLRFGRKVSLKRIKQIYASGKNTGTFGEHELELLPDGIREVTSVNEHITKFSGIEKVEATETHVFVFLGSLSAYVIPKSKISEGCLDAFVTALRGNIHPQ